LVAGSWSEANEDLDELEEWWLNAVSGRRLLGGGCLVGLQFKEYMVRKGISYDPG
jgi:hypothetical protein